MGESESNKESNTKKTKSKSYDTLTVEERYKSKTLHEHIATMPDTYVGSVRADMREMFVYSDEEDSKNAKLVKNTIEYIGAFYKIFDEIIVNARDHTVRDSTCTTIKVDIDKVSGYISVWNDGNGIPIQYHKDSKKYVPEMIFGTLLTSENYDKTGKITGGKNGYGAKCTNIYSKVFIVDTVDTGTLKRYTQKFSNNMYVVDKPEIVDVSKKTKPYCCIKYLPDFSKFGMKHITNDMYSLLVKRTYDLAACTPENVKVYFNESEIKCRKLPDYIKLFYKKPPILIYKEFNSRWKVGVVYDKDCGFDQVSFVNGICTLKGGTHVSHIVDQIVKKITGFIKSQKKYEGLNVRRSAIVDNITVYIDAVIEDPAFDSQTKETLNTKISDYGKHEDSRCQIDDVFVKQLLATGLEKEVIAFCEYKEQSALSKTDGQKTSSVSHIEKLDDAHYAGKGPRASKCKLFITEGDSAKSYATSGFSVIGKDYFGVMPIRGKFLNVKTSTTKQLLSNQEFIDIKQAMGLRQGEVYTSVSKLRYGGIIILTDQDVDGAHIKGLIMNMLESYWPELLKIKGFVQTVNTPIVKAWKGTERDRKEQIIFYTQSDYHKWVDKHTNMVGKNNIKKWTIKYYKGLGTSNDKEAKADFKDFNERILSFVDTDQEPTTGKPDSGDADSSDSDSSNDSKSVKTQSTESGKNANDAEFTLTKDTTRHFDLAFNGKFANQRKIWLSNYDKDCILEPNKTMTITYPDFVNKDLKHFSNYDNLRSIPSIMDGFKPSHRKIMCFMFKRGYNKPEAKVAQLSGYVSAETAYHHGEASLQGTIIGMAQNFVGSNNINFLCPNGNFGFRKENGKDSASARYIFTNLESITQKIFRSEDQCVLTPQFEEGSEIEPVYYAPIIPTILVNGGTGIGTGYSTNIPPFNPKDIINNIINLIKKKDINTMVPWFRGFKGTVIRHPSSAVKYISRGIYAINSNQVTITEIPVDKSTSQYCAYLNSKLPDEKENPNSIIESVKNDSLNHKISFTVTFKNDELKTLLRTGGDAKLRDFLKLDAPISLTNLHLYDADGVIKKYDSPEDILEEFFVERRKIYQKRNEYMIAKLKNNFELIKFKIKYIKYVIDETIKIKKVTMNSLLARLEELKFPKLHTDHLAPEADRTYQYLTSMYLTSLTSDKIEELEKELDQRHIEYDDYKSTSIEDRWIRELKELEKAYDKWLPESLESISDYGADNNTNNGKGKGKGAGKSKIKKIKINK